MGWVSDRPARSVRSVWVSGSASSARPDGRPMERMLQSEGGNMAQPPQSHKVVNTK